MQNIYCVHDKIGDNVICSFTSSNDGLAIRENMPALSRVAPLSDLELIHVGTLNAETFEVSNIASRVVPWDSYKFPETKLEKK